MSNINEEMYKVGSKLEIYRKDGKIEIGTIITDVCYILQQAGYNKHEMFDVMEQRWDIVSMYTKNKLS